MKSGFDAGRARAKGQRDVKGARSGAGAAEIAQALLDNLRYRQAKLPQHATRNDWYMALAYTVRDRMLDNYISTVDAITGPHPAKVVAYFSAEFLTGPHLGNSLVSLGLWDAARAAVASVGQDFATLLERQPLGPPRAADGADCQDPAFGTQPDRLGDSADAGVSEQPGDVGRGVGDANAGPLEGGPLRLGGPSAA